MATQRSTDHKYPPAKLLALHDQFPPPAFLPSGEPQYREQSLKADGKRGELQSSSCRQSPGNAHTGLQILSVAETCRRLNCSRSSLYDRLNPKSRNFDPDLPRLVHFGSRAGATEYEVDAYIRGLMQARGSDVER